MTNLTQQQLDELAKLLETNQGNEVESFLKQIFDAATEDPKNIETYRCFTFGCICVE